MCACVLTVSDDACTVSQELVKRRSTLLQKYIRRDVKFELEALYAVQLIVHKHGHPYGTYSCTLTTAVCSLTSSLAMYRVGESKKVALLRLLMIFSLGLSLFA